MKITIDKELSGTEIDDIMSGALEGGITYWATSAKVLRKPEADYEYASDVISRGGTLVITDEDGDKYVLTLGNLLKGFVQFAQSPNGTLDTDEMDAASYDSIVQFALFGELVYG